MGYDNLKLAGSHNRAGFVASVDQYDLSKSELGAPFMLARSAVASATLTGTLVETTLDSLTIPGGLLGPDGMLRVTAIYSANNSANGKNPRIKIGGNAIFAANLATWQTFVVQAILMNRGTEQQQLATPTNVGSIIGATNQPFTALALDTTVDQTLTFTATLTNIADTIELEGWFVEVWPS